MKNFYVPKKQGLYDPAFEHDSCGVGFVCDIKGRKSNSIIQDALQVLRRLSHRGAVGADPLTGDGAGILIQIPHIFLKKQCADLGFVLPQAGSYGVGLIFLPQDEPNRNLCKQLVKDIVEQENQVLIGWRDVAIDSSVIGKTAQSTMPFFSQVFIAKNADLPDSASFERKLYVIRRQIEKAVSTGDIPQKESFYITNLSAKTLIYKGLLMPHQLGQFFIDLKDKSLESALCLVHSRYSTNTFPTWDLSQPFRYLAHNGEINTLRGNINWMRARERLLASSLFGADIEKIKPIIVEGKSDSAVIDNVFELLVLSGRSLEHAMTMLIPPAFLSDKEMDQSLKDFYQYHACIMEPWDGPAAIALTDGDSVAAILDRNGLRPARYIVTKDDCVVMASEVGVLDIAPERIKTCGRLEPGKIFFIDTKNALIISDAQLKQKIAQKNPYGAWLKESLVDLNKLVATGTKVDAGSDIVKKMKAFGYTREDLKFIIKPMAIDAKEPVGSMGCDIPHAFLSRKPQVLFNYFKQLFAQVTNPAIDSIREKLVMSMTSYIGPEKNILEESSLHCHKLKLNNSILDNEQFEKIRDISINGFKTKTIYTFFDYVSGNQGFENALERICFEAEYAIEKGYSFIVLSDKGADKDNVALPSLLAVSAVHQYLVKKTIRSQVAIIVESAEPREVHHMALLFGYGADCVNPYFVYEVMDYLKKENELNLDYKRCVENYNKALTIGILKILSKMGISTLRSYRGAQIFEAVGLSASMVEKYFTNTPSRLEGLALGQIADETLTRHTQAYYARYETEPVLDSGGVYQWKKDGEFHLWNPSTIALLQDATRANDYNKYKEFAGLINDQSANPTTLRSLLKFKHAESIPLSEVEPKEEIMKRFVTGAMSFGSISRLAHETIAIALNRIKGKSNTGEGGEDPNRFIPLPNGDSRRSAIKQVASGRFGVTINYLVNADEIQIKIAQGAKPGEGGQLPGHKVSEAIARTRYTTPGVTLISPPPHHDIYSIEDLAQLIFDLKNANPKARISVKLVSEVGVGTVAAGVAKGHADMILISAGDGGTGASPRSSIRHAGLPWELGLSETHQTLVLNNLRSRVTLQTDGQLRTGKDVAVAALLGAQEFGFCTAVLIVIGCVMLRHCHLNNCSVGVATQDEILQKRFSGRVEYIVNYFNFVTDELREIMAQLGVRTIEEMVGRTDLLELDNGILPEKAKGVDYSKILYRPEVVQGFNAIDKQNNILNADLLDKRLTKAFEVSLKTKQKQKSEFKITNTDRATGAMLSSEVIKNCGEGMLLEDTIHCHFKGIAGQSFGAFLAKGITFELEGMCNDYVGKGISGGKIIIYPDKKADFIAEDNIIIGNTSFYGAIAGEAYVNGIAGERFCVRNSGLYAVVEGVGDHGCEYMTGGRVIVLGRTGKNFAAGMSGGIAYVYDFDHKFNKNCNTDMVVLEPVKEQDKDTIVHLLENHYKYTKSKKAKFIIDNMSEEVKRFIKVIPLEYKRILDGVVIEEKLDITEESDG